MDKITYRLKDGTKVPGSTTICKLLDKPYLIKWANNMGLKGINTDEYVEKTARIGTLIHMMIYSHITKTEIVLDEYSDEEITQAEKCLYKYLDWEKQHNIELIFAETPLISEKYKFVGIVDCYCMLDGKYTIIDFKSSKQISKDQILQVSSYIPLLEEHNYPVDQILLLTIGKDESTPFGYELINKYNTGDYFEIFKCLLNIYWLKKQMKWS